MPLGDSDVARAKVPSLLAELDRMLGEP